jgi:hypothetical protein
MEVSFISACPKDYKPNEGEQNGCKQRLACHQCFPFAWDFGLLVWIVFSLEGSQKDEGRIRDSRLLRTADYIE